jgi:hypothetical protein
VVAVSFLGSVILALIAAAMAGVSRLDQNARRAWWNVAQRAAGMGWTSWLSARRRPSAAIA